MLEKHGDVLEVSTRSSIRVKFQLKMLLTRFSADFPFSFGSLIFLLLVLLLLSLLFIFSIGNMITDPGGYFIKSLLQTAVFEMDRGILRFHLIEPQITILTPVHRQVIERNILHLADRERGGGRFLAPVTLLVHIRRRTFAVIIQTDILEPQTGDLPGRIAENFRTQFAASADMAEIYISDMGIDLTMTVLRFQQDLEWTADIQTDIFEADILHGDPGFARIAGRQFDPDVGFGNHDIAETAVADQTVADSEPDGIAVTAGKQAAGHINEFTGAQLRPQRGIVPAERERIVAGLDLAIPHHYESAAVNIDPVVAGDPDVAPDPQSGNQHMLTAVQETMPAGSVAQIAVLDADIAAFAEKQHLPVAHFQLEQRIVFIYLVKPVETPTVDFSSADEDIFALISNDQMTSVVLFVDAGPVLRTEMRIIPRLLISAGNDDSSGFESQSAVTAQIKGSGFVNSGREPDFAAGIDGFLDGGGIGSFSIADGTVISDIPHLHSSFFHAALPFGQRTGQLKTGGNDYMTGGRIVNQGQDKFT